MKNIQNVIDKLVNKVLAEQVTSRIENISSKIISEAEGKGCAESEGGSGCIKKRGSEWIILNNKKGGVWRDGFKSEKDAKDALSAFHANEGEMKETEDRGDFDGRKSKVVGVYSNIKKQRMEEDEVEEGNAFSAARAEAIKNGKKQFEVDGKTYPVEGEEELSEDWNDAFLSIGDEPWFNRRDMKYDGDFDFDYDEEDIDSYDDLMDMFGDKQMWFEPEGTNTLSIRDNGRKMFDMYKEKHGQPFKLRKRRMEMEEEKHVCNECGMNEEMCECGGMYNEELKGNQSKIDKNKNNKIDAEDFKMLRKQKGEKPRTPAGFEHGEIVSGYVKESKNRTLQLTEDEMIELIERIVMEQKAEGLKKTEKVLNQSKKENDSAIKAVTKKLKDYVKDGSEEPYTPEAKHFPQGNGEMKKTDKMMYTASDAVEEYIDQIARSGGMENLTYDEIKPNEEWVEMNIEGSSKTGNSQEYANAVPTDANKKVNDRRKKNYLAKLKAQSYNKAPQPVYDLAGKSTHNDAMSAPDALMAKLESTDEKSKTKINEEIQKMLNLSSYNKKTQ